MWGKITDHGLREQQGSTQYARLAVLGHYVRTTELLRPLQDRVSLPGRRWRWPPAETLIDLWLSILVACESVAQINTKLRPDVTLAHSWGRLRQVAEQSTVARLLDSLGAEQVEQIRQGVTLISRWLSASAQHDWSQPLMVDIDLTELPASAQAEGSTKGYFQKKGRAADSCVASV